MSSKINVPLRERLEAEILERQQQLNAINRFGSDVHPVGTILAGSFTSEISLNNGDTQTEVNYFVFVKISDKEWAGSPHAYFSSWEDIAIEINSTLNRNPDVTVELRIIGPKAGKVM